MGNFHNLQPFLQGMLGSRAIPKDIVIEILYHGKQNDYLKKFIGQLFGEKAWEGG